LAKFCESLSKGMTGCVVRVKRMDAQKALLRKRHGKHQLGGQEKTSVSDIRQTGGCVWPGAGLDLLKRTDKQIPSPCRKSEQEF